MSYHVVIVMVCMAFLYGLFFGHGAGIKRGRELAAKARDEKPHD